MDDAVEIVTSTGHVALVDRADLGIQVGGRTVGTLCWNTKQERGGCVYVQSKAYFEGVQKSVYLHRVIMGVTDPKIDVDHIDGDGLNNRRSNLRAVTRQKNLRNKHRTYGTSKFIGVCWFKQTSKWHAQIKVDGKRKHLGYHSDEESAARAYDAAALAIDPDWLTNEKAGRFANDR